MVGAALEFQRIHFNLIRSGRNPHLRSRRSEFQRIHFNLIRSGVRGRRWRTGIGVSTNPLQSNPKWSAGAGRVHGDAVSTNPLQSNPKWSANCWADRSSIEFQRIHFNLIRSGLAQRRRCVGCEFQRIHFNLIRSGEDARDWRCGAVVSTNPLQSNPKWFPPGAREHLHHLFQRIHFNLIRSGAAGVFRPSVALFQRIHFNLIRSGWACGSWACRAAVSTNPLQSNPKWFQAETSCRLP